MPLLWLLGACSPAGDDSGAGKPAGPCGEDPAVLVGNGELGHVSLVEGQEVVMVHGPQGGWHIWYSFVVYGFASQVSYRVTGRDEDLGLDIVDQSASVAPVPLESIECGAQVWGIFGYLPVDTEVTGEAAWPPNYLAGHDVTMGVEVMDEGGAGASSSHAVRVRTVCDPIDVGPYPGCGI